MGASDEPPTMTEAEIRAELERLAPFHHAVALPFGLTAPVPTDERGPTDRLGEVTDQVWPALLVEFGGSLDGLRVLDLASNAGGFSIEAAKSGAAYVLGVDIVEHYVEQATFLARALGLDGVEFRHMRVQDLDPGEVGQFDVVLCLGLLYHLDDPVGVMRRVSSLTRRALVVDTNLIPPAEAKRGAPLWLMRVRRPYDDGKAATVGRWVGDNVIEFAPSNKAVVRLLHAIGFPDVRRMEPVGRGAVPRYVSNRRAVYLATRPTDTEGTAA